MISFICKHLDDTSDLVFEIDFSEINASDAHEILDETEPVLNAIMEFKQEFDKSNAGRGKLATSVRRFFKAIEYMYDGLDEIAVPDASFLKAMKAVNDYDIEVTTDDVLKMLEK